MPRDGSRWWGLCAPRRLDGASHAAECVEFVIDISEAKRAEAALRESDEVVDDNADAADTTAALLESAGCVVRVAYGGDDVALGHVELGS